MWCSFMKVYQAFGVLSWGKDSIPFIFSTFILYLSRVSYSYLYSFQDLGLEMCIGCCYSRYRVGFGLYFCFVLGYRF